MLGLSAALGSAGVAAVWLFRDRPVPHVASDPQRPSGPGPPTAADPTSAAHGVDAAATHDGSHSRRPY